MRHDDARPTKRSGGGWWFTSGVSEHERATRDGEKYTSSVTTMRQMFRAASAFNQPVGEWDTTSVTEMHWMFWGATNFNKYVCWDTSGVNTDGMKRATPTESRMA